MSSDLDRGTMRAPLRRAITLNARLEDCVWLQLLHFLVQFNRLLESHALFHDFLVLDRDHAIVHVC